MGGLVAAGFVLVILRKLLKGKSQGRQRGFTLLEMVLGVAIIALIGTGVIKAVDTNARAVRIIDEQVQATNLATAYLEGIKQLAYDDSASPYASVGDTIIKPPQYNVAVNVAYGYLVDGVLTWATTNNSGTYKLQNISISVSREGGKLVLTTCTFRTTRIR